MILERSRSVQWGGGIVCILQPVEILQVTALDFDKITHIVSVKQLTIPAMDRAGSQRAGMRFA
jgi:hypothetical protein